MTFGVCFLNYAVACICALLLFVPEWRPIVWLGHIVFNRSFTHERSTLATKAELDMCVSVRF